MIVRVRGKLETVRGDQALVESGGFTWGILVCPWVGERLVATGMVGRDVTLHTMHYIEGGFGIGNLIPRLVGFLSESDMEFFALLVTVPGFGIRKALRAMTVPVGDFARAIEMNDLLSLKHLPEVGSKTAQKIVMELRGKVTSFARLEEGGIPPAVLTGWMEEEFRREAYEVLLQLQYTEAEAGELVARVSKARADILTSQELIQEIFRHQVPRR
jgi:holliday junction DNA helicase RuvA